jgi:hypothetical protein
MLLLWREIYISEEGIELVKDKIREHSAMAWSSKKKHVPCRGALEHRRSRKV